MFFEKLKATDDMDEAFTKAVWIAYLDGYADSTKESTDNLEEFAKKAVQVYIESQKFKPLEEILEEHEK
jgi:hypothetical protein